MSKMDRTMSRTAADVERKYKLGETNSVEISFASLELQLQKLSQTLSQYMANTNIKIDELKNVNTTQTWIYSGIPTLNNSPAVEWSDYDKANHIGDLYFNQLDESLYIFNCSDGVYSWVQCSPASLNTYRITYYNTDEVVIASYIIRQGDAVNPPFNDVSWVNSEGVTITFPYTPTSDTNLYVYQESTL